jgi:hypothetical protein
LQKKQSARDAAAAEKKFKSEFLEESLSEMIKTQNWVSSETEFYAN